MAYVSLGETFSSSVEWTKTMFFRPFSFKKWAIFFVIAMLAFELQGGLNLRLGNTSRGPAKEGRAAATVSSAQPSVRSSAPSSGAGPIAITPEFAKTVRAYAPLFIGLGVFALGVFLLVWWLRSVFLFVFLGSIADNDASIRGPFTKNRPLGSSYFAWTLLLVLLFLAVLFVPLKLGYDVLVRLGIVGGVSTASFGSVALAILPHILSIAALFIIAGLASFFMEDYVAVVMCKKRVSLREAAPEALRLVFASPWTTVRYIFFKIGLAIAIAIISMAASFLILVTFLAPIILLGIGLGILYNIIPAPVRTLFFGILALFGVPIIGAVIFIANMVFVPLTVFYRTFNMKFIARLDEKYDLFKAA